MEKINYTKTGGQFGIKRVLGTFELKRLPNGRIGVCDDYQNGKMVGFGFETVERAIEVFKHKDEARLLNSAD